MRDQEKIIDMYEELHLAFLTMDKITLDEKENTVTIQIDKEHRMKGELQTLRKILLKFLE